MSSLNELLIAREQRDIFEQKLSDEFPGCSLVTIRSNYPGGNKNTLDAHFIAYCTFLVARREIKNIKKNFHRQTSEGVLFFLLCEDSGIETKKAAMRLEEKFFFGRLVDIDVRASGKILSRDCFNLPPRKCLICDKPAVYCVRSRAHSTSDLIHVIHAKVTDFFTEPADKVAMLSRMVRAAMFEELCRLRSFGCVNVNGNGSHSDMDFLLMLKGIDIVSDAISNLTPEAISDFSALRKYGIPWEKKLLEECGGVNTYKGALFLLLIICACAVRVKNFSGLSTCIAEFSKPCAQDFTNPQFCNRKNFSTLSRGIRAEVLSGLRKHFDIFLPIAEKNVSSDALSVAILAATYDTTTVARGSIKELEKIQAMARRAKTDKDFSNLDAYCVAHNLSTGGVADNYIVTMLLVLIKQNWQHFSEKA